MKVETSGRRTMHTREPDAESILTDCITGTSYSEHAGTGGAKNNEPKGLDTCPRWKSFKFRYRTGKRPENGKNTT